MTTLNLSQIQGCHVINRPIFKMLLTHCFEQFKISNQMQSFFSYFIEKLVDWASAISCGARLERYFSTLGSFMEKSEVLEFCWFNHPIMKDFWRMNFRKRRHEGNTLSREQDA